MEKEKIEIRRIDNTFEENGRTIQGRAIVFESLSNDLGGFREIIKRGAISQDLVDSSDIFARTNHSDDYILARCNKGKGSLQLELREDGLYYSFEAPNTEKGNELVEHIRRGEISQSSFAFMVANEPGAERWTKIDGETVREIYKISYLGDVAPVFSPAYSETSVSLRALDKAKEMNEEAKEEPKEEDEEKEVKTDSEVKEDEVKEEESGKTESKEEKEDSEEKNVEKEERKCEKINSQTIYNKENKKSNIKKMEFRLLKAINAVANNQTIDEVASSVVEMGKEEMRKSGLSFGGQIQIPTSELRSTITVASEGEDTVATDLYDILEPLRAKNVLVQAGAKFLTGLVGDVQVPVMAGGNVTWEGETSNASDAGTSFSSVKLSPKRLTAYVDISKQFLAQDSKSAEALIRQDLINAINSKLESTILGNASGSTTQPAGLFYGQTVNKITAFSGVTDLEADIEDANVIGECKYIMSNKAKAAFRNMPKSSKSTELVMQNGNIDGTEVLNTSHVPGQGVIYGDWSNFAIGQWGGIDLTVDPYTKAAAGQVRLVINAYFDAKPLRPSAFAVGTTDGSAVAY